MANLIIKSSADDLVLKGSDNSPAITVGATGTLTFAENATFSGTANNLGTVTAGTMASTVQLEDPAVTGWFCTRSSNIDLDSSTILDFDDVRTMGSSNSESGGTITIGTAGWYFIFIELSQNGNVDDVMELWFQKNGADFSHRLYVSSMGEFQYPQVSCFNFIELAANDTVAWKGTGNFYGASGIDTMTFHGGWRVGK